MKIIFTGKNINYDAEAIFEGAEGRVTLPTRTAITESVRNGKKPGCHGTYVAYRVFQACMLENDAYWLARQIGKELFGDWVDMPVEFSLEDIAARMHARWNIVKQRRIDLSNPMQRAVVGFLSVADFLRLDGLCATIQEMGLEGVFAGANALPESTMPAAMVEAGLLLIHDSPERLPNPTHPYLQRMLGRMRVVEQWDALSKGN